jgi:hypothetical protein
VLRRERVEIVQCAEDVIAQASKEARRDSGHFLRSLRCTTVWLQFVFFTTPGTCTMVRCGWFCRARFLLLPHGATTSDSSAHAYDCRTTRTKEEASRIISPTALKNG